ncbi:M14 family metallopeptidase [Persicitalea sp.]|uniref:M14 family metallopeptidase n=1 Tax=Persicitalea sp. TaxID=3100273 RepID=UPI003593CD1B
MPKFSPIILLLVSSTLAFGQYDTRFEKSEGTQTPTYEEGIAYYQLLAKDFPQIQMQTKGLTDSGKPLHLVLYSRNRQFDITKLKAQSKAIVLINNAIHPGESDGVDASMLLLGDIALHPERFPQLDSVVLAVIPFYNIGGALNRNSTTRVNQEGPEEYGFRGNARNYDLNRDFIKADTRNARSFAAIFHELDPDLFVDTHVSNGADYQYVMTLDYTQENKLGGSLGEFQRGTFLPYLYKHMKEAGYEATPYVNAWGQTPAKGFVQFPDWPRYSTGYAALFHTIGVMTETHMLKPYDQRVKATYAYLEGTTKVLAQYRQAIIAMRKETREAVKSQKTFPLTWQVNREKPSPIEFKGYEPEYPTSEVSGQKRLYYNRDKPFTKNIPFYNQYEAVETVERPEAYVIPQGWHNVIELLKLNRVQMRPLSSDTMLQVEVYHISDVKTSSQPYEGHYWHTNVELTKETKAVLFRMGDWYIPVNQPTNRYIVETLEPKGVDSFFKWNFYDTILQAKEGYSAYVFEELAAKLLRKSPQLQRAMNEKMATDEAFAKSADAQLDYIYEHSAYREKEYLRYPVFRIPAR